MGAERRGVCTFQVGVGACMLGWKNVMIENLFFPNKI